MFAILYAKLWKVRFIFIKYPWPDDVIPSALLGAIHFYSESNLIHLVYDWPANCVTFYYKSLYCVRAEPSHQHRKMLLLWFGLILESHSSCWLISLRQKLRNGFAAALGHVTQMMVNCHCLLCLWLFDKPCRRIETIEIIYIYGRKMALIRLLADGGNERLLTMKIMKFTQN